MMLTKTLALVAETRKACAALAGLVGQAVALGVLHGTALHYAQLALAALTAVAVHQLPNAPADDGDTGPGSVA